MCDMDINMVYLMNHPFHTDIEYSDAYMGGSCMSVGGTDRIKLCEVNIN